MTEQMRESLGDGPNVRHRLRATRPIAGWDEAMPLGNGRLGCLLWGDGDPLRFSLDRADLWDTRVPPETLAEDYTYAELIRLVREKDQASILRRFDTFYGRPTPTKLPAGKLHLRFPAAADRAESELDVRRAVAGVSLAFGDRSVRVESFLHATRPLGLIRIDGDAAFPRVDILPPDYDGPAEATGPQSMGGLGSLGYEKAVVRREGERLWFRQLAAQSLEYGIVAHARAPAGGGFTVAYTVASNRDGEAWHDDADALLRQALDAGWDAMHAEHAAWWDRYWAKSAVSLPESALELERMWYLANYFFASCSRPGNPAMPLQGVWTADDGGLPPWKGDYHGDLNVQMSYWHYMKANRLEEGAVLTDFLWSLRPAAERFARSFFDAPGLCLPSVMDIEGHSLGGWPMYATNLVNQIWLCQAFDHRWRYGGDPAFLRERAYPYFAETAACVLRWLSPGADGKLYLPLSSSPEMFNNSIEAWLPPNSNNDLALLKYLFATLAEMAEELGKGSEADFWRDKLGRLPDYATDPAKGLLLAPGMEVPESHRHLSHAMCIYPLRLLDPEDEDERALIDATVGTIEALGTGLWGGHTFTWMAALYAIQGNGEGAAYQLQVFWNHLCSPNGFCLNVDFARKGITSLHGRYFTLETNLSAADTLQEMLLQTRRGRLLLFPAVPVGWLETGVAFRDLRAEGAVLVSSAAEGGRIRSATLQAERGGTFRIRNDFRSTRFRLERTHGGTAVEETVRCGAGEELAVTLQAGECCTILPIG